jgi:CheY-like chemotaxis protein
MSASIEATDFSASSMLAAAPAPRRVLVVDDHELVRYGVKTLYTELQGVPIEWLEAASLQEAIELYAQSGEIDAVLLDLNLADCKGLQGLRLFMQAYPKARVAVFSGTQDEFVIRQARALGAVGYVGKGTVTSEMRETLTALIWPSGGPETRTPSPSSAVSALSVIGDVRPRGRARVAPSRDPGTRVVRLHQPGDQQLDAPVLGHD